MYSASARATLGIQLRAAEWHGAGSARPLVRLAVPDVARLVAMCDGLQNVLMVQREQYERLERYLRALGRPCIEMTSDEVAQAIGDCLPRSACLPTSSLVGQRP